MKKPDEIELLKMIRHGMWPRDAGRILGIHWRRVQRLCEKWQRKQWYDCGVSIDLGWLTDFGQERVTELLYDTWRCSICGAGKPGHVLSFDAGLICPCDVVRPVDESEVGGFVPHEPPE